MERVNPSRWEAPGGIYASKVNHKKQPPPRTALTTGGRPGVEAQGYLAHKKPFKVALDE